MTLLTSCVTSNSFIKNEHSNEWILDLELIKKNVPNKAIGFYEFITKDQWEESINSIISDINTKAMSDEEITYRILEILTKVNNGHTNFKCGYDFNSRSFPIALWSNSNKEYYVLAISKEYEKYLGAKLISINDFKMEKVKEKLLEITPHDNPLQIDALFEINMLNENELNYLGITEKKNIFTFEMPNGDIEKKEIKAVDMENQVDMKFIYQLYKDLPIKLQRPDDMTYEYWYKLDSTNNVFYFQYNICQDKNTPDGNINLPDFYEFTDRMIEDMKKNDENFDTIIIDLRKNGGGNATLFQDFINRNFEYLSKKDIKVLTDKITYSSGVAALNDLYANFNTKSFGTETGGLIGGYTSLGNMYLKNTKSYVFFSTETTGFDALLKRQNNEFEGFIPDRIVEDSVEYFRNGIDAVYETAIND